VPHVLLSVGLLAWLTFGSASDGTSLALPSYNSLIHPSSLNSRHTFFPTCPSVRQTDAHLLQSPYISSDGSRSRCLGGRLIRFLGSEFESSVLLHSAEAYSARYGRALQNFPSFPFLERAADDRLTLPLSPFFPMRPAGVTLSIPVRPASISEFARLFCPVFLPLGHIVEAGFPNRESPFQLVYVSEHR